MLRFSAHIPSQRFSPSGITGSESVGRRGPKGIMRCLTRNYRCRVDKASRYHLSSLPLASPLFVFHFYNVFSPRLNAPLSSKLPPAPAFPGFPVHRDPLLSLNLSPANGLLTQACSACNSGAICGTTMNLAKHKIVNLLKTW